MGKGNDIVPVCEDCKAEIPEGGQCECLADIISDLKNIGAPIPIKDYDAPIFLLFIVEREKNFGRIYELPSHFPLGKK